MHVYFDSGAYAAFKPAPDGTLPSITAGGFGAYDVPKLEESIELIKRLWSGESVDFDGRRYRCTSKTP